MGVACGDLDGDGRIDLAVTNFFGESTSFYKNLGRGDFSERSAAVGLVAATRSMLGFGVALVDADNDGRLDLLSANGHVNDFRPAAPYAMPAQLLLGRTGGTLADVSARAGEPFRIPHLGRGLATGDLDNDGRVDALLVALDEPMVILRNRSETSGHWLTLSLAGATSNRDAIGAVVTVYHGEARQVATRFGGGSYLSAGDPRLHFGLGASRSADAVEVRWPSGRVDTFAGLEADRGYALREGEPTARPLARSRARAPRR
jgi:enediyne biosynthesis protein E4